ncbi:hypothetical protein [Flavobacterium sp. W22_SRS_FP1]|uniref:hypothetical protein n=1 Tax=Flavobacterium sp. W22_SRS_FP1 TaxID=3240276 RepID=UPI003F9148E4
MKKYSVSEFAQYIRDKNSGAYKDLSDAKLVDLWLKKFPEDKNKITNHSKLKKYKYLIFFASIFLLTIGYLTYPNNKYPENESELKSLLCDKYWKITGAKVNEIYIDNELLLPPSSDTSTRDSVNLLYNDFEKQLLEDKKGDCYIYFNKWGYCDNNLVSDNSMYTKGYLVGTKDIVYSLDCMGISNADGYYYMKGEKNNHIISSYDSNNEYANNHIIDEHTIKVDYIDSNKLILIQDKTYLSNSGQINIKYKTEYKIYSPLQPVKDFLYDNRRAPSLDDL